MINKEKRSNGLLPLLFLIPYFGFSQTTNSGDLYISPGTQLSTLGVLDNKSDGNLLNDGELLVYNHFNNDGLVSFTTGSTTGTIRMQGKSGFQKISGTIPMELYNVEFNNESVQPAFQLSNDISISGNADFYKGIIDNANFNGLVVFENLATHTNADTDSYIGGTVRKNGNTTFQFPTGDGGKYRHASISAPDQAGDAFSGKYFFKNPNELYPIANKGNALSLINNKEYWTVEKTAGNSSVFLTLSWDESTTPAGIYAAPYDEIHIVRWDDTSKSWVDQGGVANSVTKEVVVVTNPLTEYGVFTLARIKGEISSIDVKPHLGVSPNGDGINDAFTIDGLEKFPNNRVTVVNRYGVVVFDTTSYNTVGNVFKGFSNKNKAEVLPLGTYFYFVDYLDEASGLRKKKSGYLYINVK
jgi:gliding motility-associated-like protein